MPVRIAVVGLGMMGSTHLARYAEIAEAEVVLAADLDADRRAGAGAKGNLAQIANGPVDLAGMRVVSDGAEAFADPEVDAVDLCVPTYLHVDLTIQALEAGKHVLVEKPMALAASDARRMVDAARGAGRVLMVGHCLRFWPEYVWLREAVASGRYGPARHAAFTRLGHPPDWSWQDWMHDPARSGSAAFDLHVHDADVVLWLFGWPEEVQSDGVVGEGGGVCHLETKYRYFGGPHVVATGGWDFPPSFPFRMVAEVVWDETTAVFNSLASPTLTLFEGDTPTHPEIEAADAYAEELRHFVASVAANRPSDRITSEEAADAIRLVEAEVASVRTGRPVALRHTGESP